METKFYLFCLFLVFLTIFSNGQDVKEESYKLQRKAMVEEQIKARGIENKEVLNALMNVPRHKFVPEKYRKYAYADRPLPIGYNQTISQPYIVAYMTEILKPKDTDKILEIGTGSGYQAAILSALCREVYTIEIIAPLGEQSKKLFEVEGYKNIKTKIGDGYLGWKEHAPFDAIIVTCAPTDVPEPLKEQLAEGGRMIIPVGEGYSHILYLLEKHKGKIHTTEKLPVLFVPMIREKK